jgi:hypothetical protein
MGTYLKQRERTNGPKRKRDSKWNGTKHPCIAEVYPVTQLKYLRSAQEQQQDDKNDCDREGDTAEEKENASQCGAQ